MAQGIRQERKRRIKDDNVAFDLNKTGRIESITREELGWQ